MDDAERELDAAFARHRDSNKHAEALRDAELAASRADADAKQRALESLKETLANTRRVLEARVTAAERRRRGGGARRRPEPRPPSRRATLRRKPRRAERRRAARRLRRRANEAGVGASRTEARAKAETRAEAAEADAEHARESARASRAALRHAESKLEAESAARREATRKLDKYRREYRRRQTEDSAGVPGVTGAGAVEERARRDSVEAWLKEELRNREKTETLFVQLRDLALRPNENGAKIEALRGELDALRASVGKGESAS